LTDETAFKPVKTFVSPFAVFIISKLISVRLIFWAISGKQTLSKKQL